MDGVETFAHDLPKNLAHTDSTSERLILMTSCADPTSTTKTIDDAGTNHQTTSVLMAALVASDVKIPIASSPAYECKASHDPYGFIPELNRETISKIVTNATKRAMKT